jgi:phage shock protein A
MGIFTRFRDIISSNISAMLDKAEDPEKLIKLMIREMEDTLVEIKAACAGAMASSKKVQRQLEALDNRGRYWEERRWLKNAVLSVERKVWKTSLRNTKRSSSNTKTISGSLKRNLNRRAINSACCCSGIFMPQENDKPRKKSVASTAPRQ